MRTPSGQEQPAAPPAVRRTAEIRDRALSVLQDGPVTPSDRADPPAIAALLDVLLASLVVSGLQHEQYALLVRAPTAQPLAEFLHACADQDRGSARMLGERIRQLGFVGEYDPRHLSARSRVTFRSFADGELAGIVTQSLVGARIFVQSLQESVRWIGDNDPTTRRLLERLLEEKETQTDALSAQSFLQQAGTAHL